MNWIDKKFDNLGGVIYSIYPWYSLKGITHRILKPFCYRRMASKLVIENARTKIKELERSRDSLRAKHNHLLSVLANVPERYAHYYCLEDHQEHPSEGLARRSHTKISKTVLSRN